MTLHRRLIIVSDRQAMQEGKYSLCPSGCKECYHLLGVEWPMQLGSSIAASQHRNDQAVALEQRLVIGDIDQFDQQAVINKGHEHGFGHFAQVAPNGAEELAFRQHGARLDLAVGRSLF